MRFRTLALLSVIACLGGNLPGADTPVEGEQQSATFKKIFSYDRTLARSRSLTLFIVGADKNDDAVTLLQRAFIDQGMGAIVVWKGEILKIEDDGQISVRDVGGGSHSSPSWSSKTSVLYLMPEADLSIFKPFCADAGILSVSGTPSLAERGDVAIALDKKGDGTEIIVSLSRIKAEGHQLSADLLRLARVIH